MDVHIIKDILKWISLFALVQCTLLVYHLLSNNKGHKKSKKVLVYLLIVFIIYLTGTFVLLNPSFHPYRYYGHIANLTIFASMPLLYLYIKSYINSNNRIDYKSLKHFIPFILIFSWFFYEIAIQTQRRFVFYPYATLVLSCLYIQSMAYVFLIIRLLNKTGMNVFTLAKHKVKLHNQSWIRTIFIGFSLMILIDSGIFLSWKIFNWGKICIYICDIYFICSFLLINSLILLGLRNPDLILGIKKYTSSSLSEVKKSEIYNKLIEKINKQKIYLDPLLNLKKLSKELLISEKYLSQIINEYGGKGYFDFINHFRIIEAQNILTNDQGTGKSILEIAYEVGFNSKSSFNKAFKDMCGKTPTQYRNTYYQQHSLKNFYRPISA